MKKSLSLLAITSLATLLMANPPEAGFGAPPASPPPTLIDDSTKIVCANHEPTAPSACPTCSAQCPPTADTSVQTREASSESGGALYSYSGNAQRMINDLQIDGSPGSRPLAFTRFSMTRLSNRNLAGAAFGREASWNHSYEWNMRETAANRMTVTFPNGIEIIFKPTGDPLLWEPTRPSQTATLYKWNNSWSLTFGEDADKVVFQQRFDTANATFYRVESITDDIGNVTSITYNDVNDKLIRQVTDASGRWIKLYYNDMGVATQVGDVLHTRLANSSHAGQWQVVNLTPGTAYRFLAYYQGNTYRQKNKLKIAEIEFYDENNVKITGGTPYGSTPLVNATTGPEKAFDGNITTFYQYNYLKGGYCGIDLGASPRKVSKIRYYIIAPINDDCDLTFVGQNVQALPNWVVSHVEGSDGREIQYSYNVLTDPSGFFQWTRLTDATYPDATAAQYTYTQVHDYTMPSLLTANDPRYASALKNIRYQLGTNTVVGFVRQEINQATGIAVADVKWGADEHTPKLVYPNGRVTVAQFEENRLTKLTDSYGYKKTYTYTGTTGHLASATDELNRTTSFTRGYKGRLLSASYPGGRSITYTRDSFNRPLTINQNGRTTTHIYDVKGRRTRTTYPDTTFETWTYNTFGQPLVHRQRNGFTESYTYDASGLRRTHTDAAGAVTTWHYYGDSSYPATNDFNIAVNVVGRLAAVVDAHGNSTSYSYNDRSQITSETTTPGGNITRAGVVVQDSSLDFTTTTLNTYDDYGNLIARIVNNSDPASAPRLWQYQYDSLGRRIREEDPLNRVTYYAYDINGVGCDCGTSDKPLQITHPDGSITRHVYDKEWRLLSTTHAFGMTGLAATTSYTYDAAGQRRSMTDPLGHITRWTYDAAGNVTAEIRAFGTAIASTTSHTYDVHGNRLTSTSPVGTISTTTYDNMDRPVNMTDATGTTDAATTTYNYEPATGRMISVIDTLTRTTGFVHDPLDRVIRTNLPDANYTESFYDLLGRNYRNRDLLGNFPRRVYDSQGQTIASINAAGITTTAFYDGHGNLTQTSLPSGKSVSYTHDILGNVIKTTVALGTAEEATVSEILTRDLMLRPLTTRDGAGSVTTTTYDLLGRTLTVKNAINTLPTFTYTYDLDGQLLTTKAADNLITSTRTYDALHRLKTEKDGKNQTIEYFYDAASRMTSYKDAKLATFSFEYYPTGRLKKRNEPDTTFQTYTYDVLGRLVLHTKADGKIKTHFYENPNRDFLTKITYTLPGSGAVSEPPRIYTHAADGQILTATNANAGIARGYDAAGRIISETQSFTSGPSGTFSYHYDTVDGNLDNHTRPDGNVVDYTYNQRNLLQQVNSSSSTVAAYTYNARNQILTTAIGSGLFTATRGYDAAARLTGISNGTLDSTGYTLSADGRRTGISRNGSAESYGYDNARQVTTANYTGLSTTQSWTYDANGNRITAVQNSVTTNYTANSVNEYLLNPKLISYEIA